MERRLRFLTPCAAIALALAAAAPAAADGPTSLELAQRLVLVNGLPDAFADPPSAFKPADLDAVIARHPEVGSLTPAQRQRVLDAAARVAAASVQPGYVERQAAGVAQAYDRSELADLVGFFDSPVARAVRARQRALDAAVLAANQSLKPQLLAAVKANLCHQPAPPPPSAGLAAPPSPAAFRVANGPGQYKTPGYGGLLDESDLGGLACDPSAKPPRLTDAWRAQAAVRAQLQPAYQQRVAAAYERVFTPAELGAMAAFEDSPAGRAFDRREIQTTPAAAFASFELDQQFAAAVCAELGCRTPPDAPTPPWADPSPGALALGARVVNDEGFALGDFDPAAFVSSMLANQIKDPQQRAALAKSIAQTLAAEKPAMLAAYARLYAKVYSAAELQASADFWESDVGRSILQAKAAAAMQLKAPSYTPEQQAALAAFDASPAGVSMRAKRPKLFIYHALLDEALVAASRDAVAAQPDRRAATE